MKFVVSGNYQQFKRWCADNGVIPTIDNVKSVRKVVDILGYKPTSVEYIGTCYELEDYEEIKNRIDLELSLIGEESHE